MKGLMTKRNVGRVALVATVAASLLALSAASASAASPWWQVTTGSHCEIAAPDLVECHYEGKLQVQGQGQHGVRLAIS